MFEPDVLGDWDTANRLLGTLKALHTLVSLGFLPSLPGSSSPGLEIRSPGFRPRH